MSTRRPSSAPLPVLRGGTSLEVCAVVEVHRPMGGPALRPVGTAVINPDGTITAWLDALPTTGTLVLRADPRVAPLRLAPADEDAVDATTYAAQSPLH